MEALIIPAQTGHAYRDGAFYFQLDPMMAEESSEDQEAVDEDGDVPADVQDDAPNENTDGGDWSEPCSPIDVIIADEEFARRLHLEEQSHHRRRLMEMAGVDHKCCKLGVFHQNSKECLFDATLCLLLATPHHWSSSLVCTGNRVL